MIHIKRQRRDTSGLPIEPNREWFVKAAEEQVRANAVKGGSKYMFLGEVYGANVVRTALSELFFDKCGYCEYSLARTDINVDHYRPKGAVAEARNHPGYYWLAYEWSNLIPACTPCNQRRRELPKWPATSRGRTAGKGDSFPLKDENKRAWSPKANISLEEPLLLDPTRRNPSKHLSFHPDGTAFHLTAEGKASIKILNLNARRLYEMRRYVIGEVVTHLQIRRLLESFESDSKALVALKKIDDLVLRKTDDSAQYAAAARAVVNNPTAFGL